MSRWMIPSLAESQRLQCHGLLVCQSAFLVFRRVHCEQVDDTFTSRESETTMSRSSSLSKFNKKSELSNKLINCCPRLWRELGKSIHFKNAGIFMV